jgi:hypothetical protein
MLAWHSIQNLNVTRLSHSLVIVTGELAVIFPVLLNFQNGGFARGRRFVLVARHAV